MRLVLLQIAYRFEKRFVAGGVFWLKCSEENSTRQYKRGITRQYRG